MPHLNLSVIRIIGIAFVIAVLAGCATYATIAVQQANTPRYWDDPALMGQPTNRGYFPKFIPAPTKLPVVH